MRRRRSEVCLRQREASVFLIRRDFFHATLRFHHEHPSGKLHSGAFQRSHNVPLDLPNRLLGEVPVDLKHDARGYASSAKRLKSNPGAPTGSAKRREQDFEVRLWGKRRIRQFRVDATRKRGALISDSPEVCAAARPRTANRLRGFCSGYGKRRAPRTASDQNHCP